MKKKNLLAVIIPFSRTDFLEQTLESFSRQTCKDFTIYIGDDATPADITSLLKKFSSDLTIKYHRFDENLGRKNLVSQWARCVELSANEPWIWMFSDDDIADPGCVEAFYLVEKKAGNKFDVFRFNSLIIDEKEKVTRICPPHPPVEDTMVFAYHRLKSARYSFAQDHIFSRRAYNLYGGFIDFPAAWGSDDASWIQFSGEAGIYTIYSPFVRWRLSSINGAAINPKTTKRKMESNIQFLKWMSHKFAPRRIEELNLDVKVLLEISKDWLLDGFVSQSAGRIIWNIWPWARDLNGLYEDGIPINLWRIIKTNVKIILKRFSSFIKENTE